MQRIPYIALLFLSVLMASCSSNPNFQEDANQASFFLRSMDRLTEVSVHDIFSPPAASRVYVYPNIAAYEALRPGHPAQKSFAGQLRGLENIPQPQADQEYCFPVASLHAFLKVGKTMIFSEAKMDTFRNELFAEIDQINIPSTVYKNSIEFGDQIADHILAWADKDNYKQTRSFPKFKITDDPGQWKPTPPAYLEGIEPHWREIRPMVLDSAQQFTPPAPPSFDMTPGSDFYEKTMVVYKTVKEVDKEQRLIASFWDCNPYVMNQTGHVMYATKKITPGGHWMGITSVVCEQAATDLMATVKAHTMVSIALFDGFISCWDEKYRSNLIRPETVINEHLDEQWKPVLQTPPFPEHTSGHSVISTAAAVTLTSIFGENFKFTDDVEVPYGLPERSFDSFLAASSEAAISRLYGGIHYMPAIEDGVAQGKKVGNWIVQNVRTEAQAQ
ncbi:MAG: vanadium-dependent haloperoxidase [Bacteroidota bacterium]